MSSRLVDRLALAIVEHGPCSGSRLSILVGARKAAVLAVLEADPMFEHVGRARGSRWHLAGNRVCPPWEPQGTDPSTGLGVSDGLAESDRLAALERRVADLERRLADLGVGAS